VAGVLRAHGPGEHRRAGRAGPIPAEAANPDELRRRLDEGEWVVDLRDRTAIAKTALPALIPSRARSAAVGTTAGIRSRPPCSRNPQRLASSSQSAVCAKSTSAAERRAPTVARPGQRRGLFVRQPQPLQVEQRCRLLQPEPGSDHAVCANVEPAVTLPCTMPAASTEAIRL
jgi:hypothetical protein